MANRMITEPINQTDSNIGKKDQTSMLTNQTQNLITCIMLFNKTSTDQQIEGMSPETMELIRAHTESYLKAMKTVIDDKKNTQIEESLKSEHEEFVKTVKQIWRILTLSDQTKKVLPSSNFDQKNFCLGI